MIHRVIINYSGTTELMLSFHFSTVSVFVRFSVVQRYYFCEVLAMQNYHFSTVPVFVVSGGMYFLTLVSGGMEF